MSLIMLMSFIFTLSIIIIILASTLSKKTEKDREKASPFECGFDPFSSSRIPFSLKFFLLAIIFLVFDVEIAILLPIPIICKMMEIYSIIIITMIFMVTLILGLIHEWNLGSLSWSK